MYKIVLKLNEHGEIICGCKKHTLYMDYEEDDTPDETYINDFIKFIFNESLVDCIESCKESIIDKLKENDIVKIWDANNDNYEYGYVSRIDDNNIHKYIYVNGVGDKYNYIYRFNEFGEQMINNEVKQYITIPNKEETEKIKRLYINDFLYRDIIDIVYDINSKNEYRDKCPDFFKTEDLTALYNVLKKYGQK